MSKQATQCIRCDGSGFISDGAEGLILHSGPGAVCPSCAGNGYIHPQAFTTKQIPHEDMLERRLAPVWAWADLDAVLAALVAAGSVADEDLEAVDLAMHAEFMARLPNQTHVAISREKARAFRDSVREDDADSIISSLVGHIGQMRGMFPNDDALDAAIERAHKFLEGQHA